MVAASTGPGPELDPLDPLPRALHASRPPEELSARHRDRVGRTLAFLAPGLIHWLGNSLFAIQGHVQMLALRGQEPSRAVGEILKGSHQAQHALELLRYLVVEPTAVAAGDAVAEPRPIYGSLVQLGTLLPRLCELMRIPLRDAGVRVTYEHSSRESPASVSGTVLCLAVTELVRAYAQRVQPGFRGELQIDLARQTEWAELRFLLRHAPDLLPFPQPATALAEELSVGLAELGARLRVEPDHQTLVLGIPVQARHA